MERCAKNHSSCQEKIQNHKRRVAFLGVSPFINPEVERKVLFALRLPVPGIEDSRYRDLFRLFIGLCHGQRIKLLYEPQSDPAAQR